MLRPGFRTFSRGLVWNVSGWLALLLLLAAFYFTWLRDYQMNWGATAAEVSRYMPGDDMLDSPEFNATRAVEINAAPAQIWPWIVQMGYGKAGFYGFDRLDNGGVASAERILLEHQNLKVGDSIAAGEYQGQLFNFLEVAEMVPDSLMLWVFVATPWKGGTWSWGLYPTDGGRTRLVSRLRKAYSFNSVQDIIAWSLIDPIEILMMRTTLLGIKRRAERG